jgi:hypothetical protein
MTALAKAWQDLRHGAKRYATEKNERDVISYGALQTLVGAIALSLPPVLMLGKIFWQSPGIEATISDYYYTNMRDYFVGALCAIGVFMTSYRGELRVHNIAGMLGCLFAIGVAFCPTSPSGATEDQAKLVGVFGATPTELHFFFAACLFVLLAIFSLAIFPSPAGWKHDKNWLHRGCGWIIVGCIAAGLVVWLLPRDLLDKSDPIFWIETIAVLAFALSWLTNGGTAWAKAVRAAATRTVIDAAVKDRPAKVA